MNRFHGAMAGLACLGLLTGCGTSVYGVRIPFTENPALVTADAEHVHIEDRRPAKELETRVKPGLFSCSRLYGDDTFQSPKLVYLDQLIAARVPAPARVDIRLDRFDTIEYCENTANRAGAAAAAGASGATGNPIYIPPSTEPGGDSVHVQIAGTINGVAFDVARAFDYDGLSWKFAEMPASNPVYRQRLHAMMNALADDIVAKLPAMAAPAPAAAPAPVP